MKEMADDIKHRLTGEEVEDRVSALKMVLFNRADYYFDNYEQLNDTIKKNDITFDMNDYRIEVIVSINLYMTFSSTERGKKIKDLYDKGIEQLFRTGELEEIYKKWKNEFPELDIK